MARYTFSSGPITGWSWDWGSSTFYSPNGTAHTDIAAFNPSTWLRNYPDFIAQYKQERGVDPSLPANWPTQPVVGGDTGNGGDEAAWWGGKDKVRTFYWVGADGKVNREDVDFSRADDMRNAPGFTSGWSLTGGEGSWGLTGPGAPHGIAGFVNYSSDPEAIWSEWEGRTNKQRPTDWLTLVGGTTERPPPPPPPPPDEPKPTTDQWSQGQERWGRTKAQTQFFADNPDWKMQDLYRGPSDSRFTNWWYNPETQQFLTAAGTAQDWSALSKTNQGDVRDSAGWADMVGGGPEIYQPPPLDYGQNEAPLPPAVYNPPTPYQPPPLDYGQNEAPLPPAVYNPPTPTPEPNVYQGIGGSTAQGAVNPFPAAGDVGALGTTATAASFPNPMWPADWRETMKWKPGKQMGAPGTGQYRVPTPWGGEIGGPITGTSGIDPMMPDPGVMPDLSGGTSAALGGWGPGGQSGYPDWPGKDIGTAAEQQQYINYLNSMLAWVQTQLGGNQYNQAFNEKQRLDNLVYERDTDNLLWQQTQAQAQFDEDAERFDITTAIATAEARGYTPRYDAATGKWTVEDKTLAREKQEFDQKMSVWSALGQLPVVNAQGEFERNPDGTIKFAPTQDKVKQIAEQWGYRTNPNTGQIEYTQDYMSNMGALTGYVPNQPSTPGDSGASGGYAPGQPGTEQPGMYLDANGKPVQATGYNQYSGQLTAAERAKRELEAQNWAGISGYMPGTGGAQGALTEAGRAQREIEARDKAQELGYWGAPSATTYNSPTSMRDYATVKSEYDSFDPYQQYTTPEETKAWSDYYKTLKSEYESFAPSQGGLSDSQKTLGYRDWELESQQQNWAQQTQFPQQMAHEKELGAMSAFGRWRKPNPRWI